MTEEEISQEVTRLRKHFSYHARQCFSERCRQESAVFLHNPLSASEYRMCSRARKWVFRLADLVKEVKELEDHE